jgi:hypothetical protein
LRGVSAANERHGVIRQVAVDARLGRDGVRGESLIGGRVFGHAARQAGQIGDGIFLPLPGQTIGGRLFRLPVFVVFLQASPSG